MIDGLVMPTVRHTGSLFMIDLLSPYYERCSLRNDHPPENPLVFDHLHEPNIVRFKKWIEIYPTVVVLLRDPWDCAVGWVKRKEDLKGYFFMWFALIELASHRPFYIPIDTADRDEHLETLSKHLGVPLETDWCPVNTNRDEADLDVLKESRDAILELYGAPVIARFYKEPR